MVRLKDFMKASCLGITEFQFHYGSIKGLKDKLKRLIPVIFQFHYGSIKGLYKALTEESINDFNSTMVRLKDSP